jgi:hypothetical protein
MNRQLSIVNCQLLILLLLLSCKGPKTATATVTDRTRSAVHETEAAAAYSRYGRLLNLLADENLDILVTGIRYDVHGVLDSATRLYPVAGQTDIKINRKRTLNAIDSTFKDARNISLKDIEGETKVNTVAKLMEQEGLSTVRKWLMWTGIAAIVAVAVFIFLKLKKIIH